MANEVFSLAEKLRDGKMKPEDVPAGQRSLVLRLAGDRAIDLSTYSKPPSPPPTRVVGPTNRAHLGKK